MRKITHGNPIADRTNIASIYFSSFFLFVNIKPLNKVDSATNNPRQYISILLSPKSLNKDAITIPVKTYFETSMR